MINFVFNKLLQMPFNTEGDISVLNEFNSVIKIQSVLFYPSSGADINDLFYVNSKRIEEINECSPNIFVHTDFMFRRDYGLPTFDQLLEYPNFYISNPKYLNDDKSINIYKLRRPNSNEIKWLIFFRGYYNEDIIKELIINKIKIPVVYAICDGITHGMGACNEKNIPTILYPLLASDLGIKFIITEQGWDTVKKRLEDASYTLGEDEFRLWLKNILLISDNLFIKHLLNLSNEDLRNILRRELGAINEKSLNEDGKLRCYHVTYTKEMKLKKMNL